MRKWLFHPLYTGLWMLVAFSSQRLVAQMDFAVIGDAGALTSASKQVRESMINRSHQLAFITPRNPASLAQVANNDLIYFEAEAVTERAGVAARRMDVVDRKP
jgi:hypothetical protein